LQLSRPIPREQKPGDVRSQPRYAAAVITCVVEYVIDPRKIEAFESFARRWMELVELHGGSAHNRRERDLRRQRELPYVVCGESRPFRLACSQWLFARKALAAPG